ncbi:uncharacterized protein BJ171DRAFT_509582 [Polychytrium aggregatum]|uniref:uncharacterized protein n=1 Tax=Polychytrium aggregatum TaxID=110093 RepID=UPI0022FEA3A7|nr:uncharacterized protein BJ171DRAFT_509582 [Polychytrium aggregatum]KAI9203400.1 hypothetical protein BJ171DRAFT_509582 [Polychytrium aggregatum]
MGNTSAKLSDPAKIVDGGELVPHGIYSTAPQDYDIKVVQSLIQARRLSPFYKGLEDLSDSQFHLHFSRHSVPMRREENSSAGRHGSSSLLAQRVQKSASLQNLKMSATASHTKSSPSADAASQAEHIMKEIYKDAFECPICFLYYPRNMNFTRCCDQPICTECFVQIQRPETTWEPASCPYCVMAPFGVVYDPPGSPGFNTRYGITVATPHSSRSAGGNEIHEAASHDSLTPPSTPKRRPSTSHLSKGVVTSDDIRPNWREKQQQQAMERIARERRMRSAMHSQRLLQLQDQLLANPESINTIATTWSQSMEEARASQRGQREHRSPRFDVMRAIGADLDDLMLMEAIRRSIQDQQRAEDEQQQALAQIEGESSAPTDGTAADPAAAGPSAGPSSAGPSAEDTANFGAAVADPPQSASLVPAHGSGRADEDQEPPALVGAGSGPAIEVSTLAEPAIEAKPEHPPPVEEPSHGEDAVVPVVESANL